MEKLTGAGHRALSHAQHKVWRTLTAFFGWLLGITLLLSPPIAHANPEGETVVSGNASVERDGSLTTIHQSSERAVIDWHTFNIGTGEHTHFEQPSSSAVTLNRVTGGQGASQIFGQLTATGQVWILNPQGVYFGSDAYVNVAGVLASTYDISNQDFMSGNHHFIPFAGDYNGRVLNEGTVVASGLAALLSHDVENIGLIRAHLGQIILGSNPEWTLDFYGDDLIHITVDQSLLQTPARIVNSGELIADGGYVFLSIDQAEGVLENVINHTGLIGANTVALEAGIIVLSAGKTSSIALLGDIVAQGEAPLEFGGHVHIFSDNISLTEQAHIDVTGHAGGGEMLIGGDEAGLGLYPHAQTVLVDATSTLKADGIQGDGGRIIVWADDHTDFFGQAYARALGLTGNGGFVETSGKLTIDFAGAMVDASSINGLSGSWLVDPGSITIDSALALTIVTVLNAGTDYIANTAGTGSITIDSDVIWTSNNKLSLISDDNIFINATLRNTGSGELDLSATNTVTPNANGVIDVYDFTLTSGDWRQVGDGVTAISNFSVRNDFHISDDTDTTSSFWRFQNGALNTTPFEIIDVFGLQGVGSDATLFDQAFVLNNDIDATVTTAWSGGEGFAPIAKAATYFTGSLDGNDYAISDLYINRSNVGVALFSILSSGSSVKNLTFVDPTLISTNDVIGVLGGYFGFTDAGGAPASISNVHVTGGSIQGGDDYVGGLVGYVWGADNLSITNVSVKNTTVFGDWEVGGLIGRVQMESSSYTLTVDDVVVEATVTGTGFDIGGIIGYVADKTVLSNAYSNSTVTSSQDEVGGLVGGADDQLTITSSFTTGSVTARDTVGGLVGTLNNSASTINDSYSLVDVVATNGPAGGLIGHSQGTVTNSYAAGSVSVTLTGSAGGLAGSGTGTFVDSYWDEETTGQSSNFGTGGNAKTHAEMITLSEFNANWDFTNTWKMIDGYTYPRLQMEGDLYAVAGTVYSDAGVTVAPNKILEVLIAGSLFNDNVLTAADGTYSFGVSSIELGINGDDTPTDFEMLIFGQGAKYNTVIDGSDITANTAQLGIDLWGDTVSLGVASGAEQSTALLSSALGTYSDPDILYEISDTNVILDANIGFKANSAIAINHNITSAGANLQFDDAVTLNTDTTLSTGAGSGTVTFSNTVDSLAGNLYDLTVMSDTSVQFNDDVGGTTTLADLTITGVSASIYPTVYFNMDLDINADSIAGTIDFSELTLASFSSTSTYTVNLNGFDVISGDWGITRLNLFNNGVAQTSSSNASRLTLPQDLNSVHGITGSRLANLLDKFQDKANPLYTCDRQDKGVLGLASANLDDSSCM